MATYALIHGAGDVGWSWHLVAAELRERGHEAVAPDLPCEDDSAGLWDWADAVVHAIPEPTDLVVVAHSLGGFTGPMVCERVPVELLVLVAAMVPTPGESANAWWSGSGYAAATRGQDAPDDPIELFYPDVPRELAVEALSKERDVAARPMGERWPLDAWPDVPTRYLLCRDDRVLPADWTRGMVRERLGIEADEIEGGHCPFLSRPKELAERLDGYRFTSG
jgi:pimeloyl-ACP methyl ester carboxylesterase